MSSAFLYKYEVIVMTLLWNPPREPKTGRLQISFPRSLYFHAIPSEERGSLTACTPETIWARGSKHGVLVMGSQSTSVGSGLPELPRITTHWNRVYGGWCRVRTRMPNASLNWERERENAWKKNSSRVGSSLHHLWLRKILSHVATDARKEFRGNITICLCVLTFFLSIHSWQF